MKLIKLPNGSWIDPATVTAVLVHPREYGVKLSDGQPLYPPRVSILSAGAACVIPCDDLEQAAQIAVEWAEKINASR